MRVRLTKTSLNQFNMLCTGLGYAENRLRESRPVSRESIMGRLQRRKRETELTADISFLEHERLGICWLLKQDRNKPEEYIVVAVRRLHREFEPIQIQEREHESV